VVMYSKLVSATLPMRFLVLALAWLVTVSGVPAQDARKQKFEVFAQFGGAFYTSVTREFEVRSIPPLPLREDNTFAKTGGMVIGIRSSITDKHKVEVSYSYSPGRINSFTTGSPLVDPGPVVLWFYAHGVSFNYVRAFEPRGRVEPFLTVGAGFAVFRGALETEGKPAVNFGIGMDFRLTDRWAFRLEQRTVISSAPRGAEAVSGGTLLHFVPSAGFVFRF
jgi:hypothetical protein